MDLPKDPFILVSLLNMKLRDAFDSLDALCDGLGVDKEAVLSAMRDAGFEYDAKHNRFR